MDRVKGSGTSKNHGGHREHRGKSILSFLSVVSVFSVVFLSACATDPAMQPPLVRGAREIEVTAWQFGYDPRYIQVQQGDRIRFVCSSLDVAHTLTSKELGVNIAIPPRGADSVEFEFVPPLGDYIFHCEAPCGPARSLMKLRMIVVGGSTAR